MRALYWNGVNDLRVETVTDPEIVNPHDAILQVTLSTTCGSDLHFIDGYIPTMKPGDVIGHEFMGSGRGRRPRGEEGQEGRPRRRPVLHRLRPVLVLPAPALLAVRQHASRSPSCRSRCSATRRPASTATPTPSAATPARTPSTSACRSPTTTASRSPRACRTSRCCSSPTPPRPATWAPTSATSSPATRSPSGAAAASGLMAQQSAYLLGAERVIAIDRFPERLRMAREHVGSETINYTEVDSVLETLKEMTGGRGPDACIDAVGMEAHGTGLAIRLRPRQAGAAPADRPRPGAARGDHGLPQGRDRCRSSASTG